MWRQNLPRRFEICFFYTVARIYVRVLANLGQIYSNKI